MSSFLFERDQINCNCFDNSPKNAPRIFRVDPTHSNKTSNKQAQQTSERNNSEHGKLKKKSLKKGGQPSNHGSEKDPKQKDETINHPLIPDIPTAFSSNQIKKQQKIIQFDHFQPTNYLPLQSQRNKPLHNLRMQRPQTLYQPAIFQSNYKKIIYPPSVSHSQKIIIDSGEYDKKINEQFQKDFHQFKLNMQKIEPQNNQPRVNNKNRKQSALIHKLALDSINFVQIPFQTRYPAKDQITTVDLNQKSHLKAGTFKNSAVSNRQKISIKKEKNKILPKQIQSQKDSNSQTESDKLSEVVGRGWDGLTEKRVSLYQTEKGGKPEKTRMETMATQQSHIQTSQINTFSEFSNIMASPKSLYSKRMAFGGVNQYGIAGMSYQHIDEMKKPTFSSSKNIHH